MTDRCHIYIPFQLAEGRDIQSLPFAGEIDGCAVELKKNEPYYTLTVSRIPSEEAADARFAKLLAGLYWFAVDARTGLLVKPNLQQVRYTSDVQAVIDGGEPATWPENKQIVVMTGQQVNVILSHSPSKFLEVIADGMRLVSPTLLQEDSKLRLGIDLYFLSHFRSSDFARFLVLCVVLETVAPKPPTSKLCADLIDKWIAEADTQSKNRPMHDVEREQLVSLARRLENLKEQSHRSRIQNFVKDTLSRDGRANSDDLAREARDLYDIRGKLTHTGEYDLGNGLSRLEEIVCLTLRAAMRQ